MGIVSIILAGLKFIGIILQALLILLIFILLLVLFLPFVYRFRVNYSDKKFALQGAINFLFIRAGFEYAEGLHYTLKAGFTTLASSENEAKSVDRQKEKKRKKRMDKKEKAEKEKTEKEKVEKVKAEDKATKESIKTDIESTEEFNEVHNKEESEIKTEIPDKKVKKKKLSLISKIKKKTEAVKAKWKSFKESLTKLNIKKDAIIKFLNADGTLDGAVYFLVQGKKLIKSIYPRKINGRLKFGTGDAYTEGQYLSYLCLLYPLYGGKLQIEPEWEEEVFEADVAFSGRITAFIIILITVRVLLNKNIKQLRKNYNRCKKSFEGC